MDDAKRERYSRRTETLAEGMARLSALYDCAFYIDADERLSLIAADHTDSTDVTIVGEGL